MTYIILSKLLEVGFEKKLILKLVEKKNLLCTVPVLSQPLIINFKKKFFFYCIVTPCLNFLYAFQILVRSRCYRSSCYKNLLYPNKTSF